jgi:3-deoxy-manno-octulosonate cytidylyltransferase (CMP-KDO synthetase)
VLVPTLAVIPARLGALRLPRKPLRLLAGKPLVVRVLERVRALNVAERCIVATDSAEVGAAVAADGGEWLLTSPEHPSGTDRVAEVASRKDFQEFDVILNVQGDEPFVSAAAVRGAAAIVAEGRFPLGTAAVLAEERLLNEPGVVKVVCADNGRAMYFSRAPIPWLRDQNDRQLLAQRVRQHLGIYAYTRDALARWVALPPHELEIIERLEQLRPLAAGIPMGVATVNERAPRGIDTEADLADANERWHELTAGRV